MSDQLVLYSIVLLASTFVAAVSQVLLKKSAMRSYSSRVQEYLNPLVIFAYVLFFLTTILCVLAYRVVPLSYGPILEATSYIYIAIFGLCVFGEKLNKKKVFALALIVGGIIVYSFGV